MKMRPEILDHWPEVSVHFTADFDLEATARSRGAFTRAREIKNAETLLRLALAYGGCGMSLRETCEWAEAGGIVCLSHPPLIDWPWQKWPMVQVNVNRAISVQAKI